METNSVLPWVLGIAVGALFGGFFGFAYGLQNGKKKVASVASSFYLNRDDLLSLVSHRIHEIIRVLHQRIPVSKRYLRHTFTDDDLVVRSEFAVEYARLIGAFISLSRPEVDSAVRRVTAIDVPAHNKLKA